MAGKFSRSWDIFKTSAKVLGDNKTLLVFPFFSIVASLLILAGVGVGYASLDIGSPEATGESPSNRELAFVFVIYLSLYSVMIFFNSALVASVSRYLEGGKATIGYGLGVAGSRMGTILGYALIAATVGVLLWALERRLAFIGQIVVRLLGAAWTVATFLVVPILVHRDVGPVDAVRESGALLKKTWGENIIANSAIGLLFMLMYVPIVLLAVFIGYSLLVRIPIFGIESEQVLLGLLAALVLIALLLSLVQTALTGIYGAALYGHTVGADGDAGTRVFSPETLDGAFSVK